MTKRSNLMKQTKHIADLGIARLTEYLEYPADKSPAPELDSKILEKARMGHKALTVHSTACNAHQRRISTAFAIGKHLELPSSSLAPLYEDLTGQAVAHILPKNSEQSGKGGDENVANP